MLFMKNVPNLISEEQLLELIESEFGTVIIINCPGIEPQKENG